MGMSYSILASALWPLVSHVIPQHQIGTAYGMYVMISLSLQHISCELCCYSKTLYLICILIWRISSVEISLHFNLVFSQGVLCKVKFQVTLSM